MKEDSFSATTLKGNYLPLCISSSKGGGGKTLLSLGLARALKNQGFLVKPFKKGPDYIDAAWLAKAAGQSCTNLDLFFLSPQKVQEVFGSALKRVQKNSQGIVALVEGNRGLYDGLDLEGSCSTAELCRILKLPIVLTLNCTKTTRTLAALVNGLTSFEKKLSFAGLILNCVGTNRQKELLEKVIHNYTELTVLGALPRLGKNPLPERHMGLASCGKEVAANAEERLEQLGKIIKENIDLEKLLNFCQAKKSPEQEDQSLHLSSKTNLKKAAECIISSGSRLRLGLIQDQAFWFYYEENLQALSDLGAELVPLSLAELLELGPSKLGLCGLYIGGGFPEDHAKIIAKNSALGEIKKWAEQDFPIYAECGGLLLLARTLSWQGQSYPMAGLFPLDMTFGPKPRGLGYTFGKITRENPYYELGLEIKGHEFHYSGCGCEVKTQDLALSLERGHGLGSWAEQGHDGLIYKNVWASYTHIFAPAVPSFAKALMQLAWTFKANNSK
ncbi:MAG: cobyrinate a,c-diamide synthase [Desulfovibrio sp.]|nr:cobyrinate a,c-diamide synthase [Desulfovibrio sp.]